MARWLNASSLLPSWPFEKREVYIANGIEYWPLFALGGWKRIKGLMARAGMTIQCTKEQRKSFCLHKMDSVVYDCGRWRKNLRLQAGPIIHGAKIYGSWDTD